MTLVCGDRFNIAERRNALLPGQRAALEARLEGKDTSDAALAIPKRPSGELLPLTPNQYRLWLHQQLNPTSSAYHLSLGARIRGDVRAEILEQCLNRLIERHDALRITFRPVGGEPVQIVSEPFTTALTVVDLSAVPESERRAMIGQEAFKRRLPAFDLEVGPLFRVCLLRCGPDESIFLMVTHHLISDGWSQGIILRDLAVMYGAQLRATPANLPKLEVQFADYAHWYSRKFSRELFDERLAAWWKMFSDAPASVRLPGDKPRSEIVHSQSVGRARRLPGSVLRGVRDLARRHGTTPYVVLLAAFGVFLKRYTGQSDFSILSPTANRDRKETAHIVGFLVNTLWLRLKVGGDPTFSAYLNDVHQAAIDAYAFQDISPPLAVVGASQDGRLDIGARAMQLGFLLENTPTPRLERSDFDIARRSFAKAEARFDLALIVQTNLKIPIVGFEFRPEHCDAGTIERMLANFVALLEGIVADPDRRISALPLLSEAERRQLLEEWNDTAADYPSDKCLHELFVAQAARTPDAVAAIYEDRHLTYAQLDRRSNQLAHYLRGVGVGPETIVALCVERSLEMVVGLLGIWKAGGAYLPLDPEYPPGRLAYMLAQARAPIAVTQARLVDQLPEHDARVVRIDADWAEIAAQPAAALRNITLPENLAYVTYTSGSTGKPKGVLVRHCGLCNLAEAQAVAFQVQPGSRVLQFASLSFDASIWEITMAFRAGATLCLGMSPSSTPASDLAQVFQDQEINTATLPPSALPLLAGREFPALQTLIVAGEACPIDLASHWASRCCLINAYGPTESTVCASFARYRAESGRLSIGRPISNTRIYVLDDHLLPVPVGVTGELYVGGAGLARGYVGRAGLTAERFIASPFGDGERLYRTGDLARWRGEGELEFIGRIDHQVKLRGYRIELGEIEAALRGHPGVKDAVVAAREDTPGEKRLVGYVVGRDAAVRPDPAGLREHLKNSLPDYMIPSAFVLLDALPLTPNGKIDRKALPAPDGATVARSAYIAPRTPTEAALAGIWAEVLKVGQVGVNDNFFELGGHSLLATRVAARLREAFGLELPLRALFEAPTLEGLAASVEGARRENAGPLPPVLAARPRPDRVPLSFAQERLWLLDQLEALGSAYHIAAAVRLQGRLDVAALERSFAELIRRHEVLRTRFTAVDGSPVQVIEPAGPLRLEVEDCSGPPAARRRTAQIVRAPFDLARGPLLRARLLKLSEQEYVAIVVLHHIVSDGWSMGVLIGELGALYGAFIADKPSVLPELGVQYADYALWQREWLAGEALARQVGYWKDRLAGAPAALDLPTDRVRPAVQSFKGAAQRFALSAQLRRDLDRLAREAGATLFMVLLAAFQVVLGRWSGQRDIVIGTPIAGRTQRQSEGLIGFFVNTLALRADLSGDPTFRELVGRVKEAALGAYAHQDLPFEKLVEELQPARDLSRQPIFQVLFALQNMPRERLELPGLHLSRTGSEHVTAKFDLSLQMAEAGAMLRGYVEYAVDLFDRGTIERLIGHLRTLLEGIAADPDRRISALPLLTPAQRHRLITQWNDTAADYPSDQCVHELFAAQATRTPDAVAVVHEDRQLSYAELDRRSNQLAHHLRELGVGPEVVVGLCLERSLDMVVALLGILKAGAAYLPLDPAYPHERLAYMLADARVTVLVTQDRLRDQLPQHDASLVPMDSDCREIARQPDSAPPAACSPDNLAYVIYTSGSTGRPKGVAIAHRNAAALMAWAHRRFSKAELKGVLASTSVCFDLSVFEIFVPLCCGGECIVTDTALHLPTLPAADRVTLINTVPSVMRELLSQGTPSKNVVTVNLAGEALATNLVREIHHRAWAQQVWNLYGPSEDTTYSTGGIASPDRDTVTIGRALANKRSYVLDVNLQPVPIGTPSELYVGGAGLARGYLGRAGLTAERFVPSPFGDGERLYRTGDLARWRADGELEFIGRIDHQVKLRGYRIELGEIETALRTHPGVKDAVVVAREDTPNEKRLVGYVVGQDGTSLPEAGALRAHLKNGLPDYMIPSAFVTLPALPLTPNGKIDRKALPVPDGAAVTRTAYLAPRTPTEEMLAGIWAEVLKIEKVGVNDNFFELGGHSLSASRLAIRIRDSFAVEIGLRSVFEAPTIAGLTTKIETERQIGTGVCKPPLVKGAWAGGDPPLSFAQERMWFLNQLMPDNPAQNLPAAYRLVGPLDVPALERSFAQIIERHDVLRATFKNVDGRPVQVIAPPGPSHLPHVDLQSLPPSARRAEVLARFAAEAKRPFRLDAGPLYRATLLRVDETQHVVLFTIHHIIADGWSFTVLLSELEQLYRACRKGERTPLPALPVQYADFAHWQRQLFGSEAVQLQLAAWKRKLEGAPPATDLPTDYGLPARISFRGDSRVERIPQTAVADFTTVIRNGGATLFMGLLAALKLVLFRWTGQTDLVVGSVIGHRSHVETEALIGCFMNFLPFRSMLDANETIDHLLRQVRATVLEAYAAQDCPFEKIIEVCSPIRRLNQNPVYNVGFLLQNFPRRDRSDANLRISQAFRRTQTAQLDLRFIAVERHDGVQLECEFNAELFKATTIEALLAFYREVIEIVGRRPHAALDEIFLPPQLQTQVLLARARQAGQASETMSDGALSKLLETVEAMSEDEVASLENGNTHAHGNAGYD